MANAAKKKGTAAETALLHDLESLFGRPFRRTPPTSKWDVEAAGEGNGTAVIRVLATRPDRGRWLVSMSLSDWALDPHDRTVEVRVEVKRYKAFAHHRIFESKFGEKA